MREINTRIYFEFVDENKDKLKEKIKKVFGNDFIFWNETKNTINFEINNFYITEEILNEFKELVLYYSKIEFELNENESFMWDKWDDFVDYVYDEDNIEYNKVEPFKEYWNNLDTNKENLIKLKEFLK